jgi:AcrR family transcriptional regulator
VHAALVEFSASSEVAVANAGPRRTLPSGGWGERSTSTRSELIAAIKARDVGFAGASAREIARRAGCNQAQVFYHFGSVNDLPAGRVG